MLVNLLDQTITYIDILNNQRQGNVKEANEFLMDLQKSNNAWQISSDILDMRSDNNYLMYFAAQTLRIKIQMSYEELTVDMQWVLKNKIMSLLENSELDKFNVVLSQLCLAMADIYCHMVKWDNGLSEILSRFSTCRVGVLLEVLKYLPEEMHNRALKLGVNRTEEIFTLLQSKKLEILSMLSMYLRQSVSDLQDIERRFIFLKSIKCFQVWFCAEIFDCDADFQVNDNIDTIKVIYHVLECYVDAPTSVVTSCCEAATQLFNLEAIEHRLPFIMNCLLSYLNQLGPTIKQINGDNTEIALGYTKMCCEAGLCLLTPESFSSSNHTPLINLLVTCSGLNADCCLEVVLAISDVLSNSEDSSNNSTQHQSPHTDSTQFVILLMNNMLKYGCSSYHHQDSETLLDFRQTIYQAMQHLVPLIQPVDNCFIQLVPLLNDPATQHSTINILASIVRYTSHQTDATISQHVLHITQHLLTCLIQSPTSSDPAFIDVACSFLAEISSWAGHNQAIPHIITTLLQCLPADPPLLALSAYTKKYPDMIILSNETFSQVINACLLSLSTPPLPRETSYFYESLGKAILRTKHNPLALDICLKELVRLNMSRAVQVSEQHVCNFVDNVAGIFSALGKLSHSQGESSHEYEPVVQLVESIIWPGCSLLLDRYQHAGEKVIERVVRLLRYCLRCVKVPSIIPQLADKLVPLYIRHPSLSCLLYLAAILVDEFSAIDTSLHGGFTHMYQALANPVLEQSQLYPNITEDFLRLSLRMHEACLLQETHITTILPLTIQASLCLSLDTAELAVRLLSMLPLSSIYNARMTPAIVLQLCKLQTQLMLSYDSCLPEYAAVLLYNILRSSGSNSYDLMLRDSLVSIGPARHDGLLYVSNDQMNSFIHSVTSPASDQGSADLATPKTIESALIKLTKLFS